MQRNEGFTPSPSLGLDQYPEVVLTPAARPHGLYARAATTVTELRARRRQVQSLLPGRAHRLPGMGAAAKPSGEQVTARDGQLGAPRSKWVDIDGPVHYVDYGGPAGAPAMVMVHGLMAAHVNWNPLAPELTDEYRVFALDLVGHGRTARAGRGTDVRSHQRVLHRFLSEVVDEPVVLVGSSMGGLISILQAAEQPETVRGLILVGPALPVIFSEIPSRTILVNYLPLAVPLLGTALLAIQHRTASAEQQVRSAFEFIAARPNELSEHVIREHIDLAEVRIKMPGTPAGYQAAALSTVLTVLQVSDYAAKIRSVEAPVFLIQGEEDKVVSPKGARKVAAENPHWDFEGLPGVGHAPMMEVPSRLADSMRAWTEKRLA